MIHLHVSRIPICQSHSTLSAKGCSKALPLPLHTAEQIPIQYLHPISFTGQLYSTVSLEFEDRGYLLRDFALVKVDGERKKMMLRDERNTIYVFELIY